MSRFLAFSQEQRIFREVQLIQGPGAAAGRGELTISVFRSLISTLL
jgi:hypothetical protein